MLLSTLMLSIGSARAAEKITWHEFQVGVSDQLNGRKDIDVFTKDGRKHRAEWLRIEDDSLELYDKDNKMSSLPRASVKRIKVPRNKTSYIPRITRNFQMTMFGVALLCWDSCNAATVTVAFVALAPITVPLGAFTVATAPVYLALQGISSLKPKKAYEIVQ